MGERGDSNSRLYIYIYISNVDRFVTCITGGAGVIQLSIPADLVRRRTKNVYWLSFFVSKTLVVKSPRSG